MPSTNGHGPQQRAVLYARVSTEEQARSGYSLAQQLEALRGYATREGYEVLEEVTDSGQSGASLVRPGMDRVRDLVAAGGVCAVLAQDRDRFAREPAYHYLLKKEFEEHGATLRSLNDRGDDSPEGQLTDDVLDVLAKFERAKFAERSRRGKLRKAREGKVIANGAADYGFRYDDTRENYLVDEEAMRIVESIFRMVALDGRSLRSVKGELEAAGIPTPTRKRYWSQAFIRGLILDDVYRPHTYEEVEELVTPEVAARLDSKERYGIWWFNRTRVTRKQVAENGSNGRRYRRTSKTAHRPATDWIAVPVSDSGIPRKWVDIARKAIKDNRRPPSAERRFWELSGGILHCGCCGRRMLPDTKPGRVKDYFYYRCSHHRKNGKDACPNYKSLNAQKVESWVWEFVSGLLQDPEQLRQDLERMIEQERQGLRGDPDREAKAWLQKMSEADEMRANYQEMAARRLITFEELEEKLGQLEDTRKTAERELRALEGRREHIEQLERDKDTLLDSYTGMVPEALHSLTPEERHRVYEMLKLRALVYRDERLELSGAFTSVPELCAPETAYLC